MIDSMMNEKTILGESSSPRFEFRSFGQNFENAHFRMSRLSSPVPENVWKRNSEEIYIISHVTNITNTKIREGKLDIKTLVQTINGLEQWKPLLKEPFPVSANLLVKEVFPSLGVDLSEMIKESYSLEDFLKITNDNPKLLRARVKKERYGYMVNDTICEFGYVWINGAKVCTISSESTDPEAIQKTMEDIGLKGVENINYLEAIKRVTGLLYKPLANE